MRSPALLTDRYELTMLQAALRTGSAHRRAVFELFARQLPGGRRFGVVAGTGRFLDELERFGFTDEQVGWLLEQRVVDEPTAQWLATYRFGGDVWGYPEGETYFAGSPVLVVEASFAEAVLLETLALSVFNHDSAVASAASRMTCAAGERPCIEMGSRRTHEQAAVASARAAYLAGFAATSNLQAGATHGVPTTGTSAHSFTLLHDSEREAFTAQVDSLGAGTTLLVDTYDVETAVRTAVEVTGTDLGAVRLDSGDLVQTAREVRRQLDRLGARQTRIVVTGDLDEHAIAALAAAPVDGYGVGTSLVTGSGHPTCGFVYKLVARGVSAAADAALVGVAKNSPAKATVAGRKWALRRLDADKVAEAEVVGVGRTPVDDGNDRPLLVTLVRAGERVWHEPLTESRTRHLRSRAELPLAAFHLSRGEPALPTVYETK
ncbi:nicotinate phosphoribosyltransferase [soil metagenome]